MTKPKKAKPPQALQHFTSLSKAMRSPDRCGTIEVPERGHQPTEIPPDIDKLQRLTSLIIKGWVPRVPAAVFALRSLESLDLRFGGEPLPDAIGNLTKLTFLSVRGVGGLPDAIGRLARLEGFSLTYCNLAALPASLTKLTKMKRLAIENVKGLGSPLPNFGLLTALERLQMKEVQGPKNLLDDVDFAPLEALVSLTLDVTPLADYPKGLRALPKLEDLRLPAIERGGWGEHLGTFPSLKSLIASNNGLTAWPSALNDVSNLDNVDFNGAAITTIDALRSLPALQYLDLSRTPLARLPERAPHLPALRVLRLDKTKLTALPSWLSTLPALTYLVVPFDAATAAEIDALRAAKPGLDVQLR